MSLTYTEIPITSSTTLSYAVPFPVIDEAYIHVFINGVELVSGTGFTVSNSNALITLTTAPTVGAMLLIRRQTKADSKLVDFQADAILTEADLDLAIDQVFNLAQESKDRAEDSIVKDFDGQMDAQNRVIKNVANGVAATDAVTKGQVDVQYPKIEVVAANTAGINTVAADLNATPSLIGAITTNLVAIQNASANAITATSQATASAASAAASAVSATASAASASSGATSATNAAASAVAAAGNVIPSQTGNSGKYLGTDGTSATWTAVDALPSQATHTGKYLGTNGSTATWNTLDTDANSTTKGLYEMKNTIGIVGTPVTYVITTGNNALSAGPITIESSSSVTIPSGSTWVIA